MVRGGNRKKKGKRQRKEKRKKRRRKISMKLICKKKGQTEGRKKVKNWTVCGKLKARVRKEN